MDEVTVVPVLVQWKNLAQEDAIWHDLNALQAQFSNFNPRD